MPKVRGGVFVEDVLANCVGMQVGDDGVRFPSG